VDGHDEEQEEIIEVYEQDNFEMQMTERVLQKMPQ
jgi:hypothetical protein